MRTRSKGSYQPSVMKDRFAGGHQLGPVSAGSRNWDEGGQKDYGGAPIAPYQGSVRSQKSAAKVGQGTVMHPGRTTNGQTGTQKLGYPKTGGPHGMGVSGGHGPKSGNTGFTKKTYQGGKTKGPDKSPKPMRDRFRGGSTPKSK